MNITSITYDKVEKVPYYIAHAIIEGEPVDRDTLNGYLNILGKHVEPETMTIDVTVKLWIGG